MAEQFRNSLNNPTSTLASGISSGATSLTVASGHGTRFPSTGDFRVKLTDQTDDSLFELVKATGISSDTLTVVRGAESATGGGTARAFNSGDLVDLVLSAGGLGAGFVALSPAANQTIAPTADVPNLLLTGSASRTATMLKITDSHIGFSPPRVMELFDAYSNQIASMFVEKYFSGASLYGAWGASAYTSAGVQKASMLIDGSGSLNLSPDIVEVLYPIYVARFDTGAVLFKVTNAGVAIIGGTAAPSDATFTNSTGGWWWDTANSVPKWKGKKSDATVVNFTPQAQDSDLDTIAGLTPTNDDFIQRKSGAWANRTVAQVLTDLAAAGTTFQPLDSDLTAFAGLAIAADKLPYGTGSHTLGLADFTSAARTLLDDTTTAAMLTTLGAQPALLTENVQTDDYTLVLGDAGLVCVGNKASTLTFTVPPNSSVAFPTGTVIPVHQRGAGQLVVAQGAGVTINSPGGKLKLTGQYSSAALRKYGTDTWVLAGDITT